MDGKDEPADKKRLSINTDARHVLSGVSGEFREVLIEIASLTASRRIMPVGEAPVIELDDVRKALVFFQKIVNLPEGRGNDELDEIYKTELEALVSDVEKEFPGS